MKTKNLIKIFGSKASIESLRELVETKKSSFDFNAVIPEPKRLAEEKFDEENIDLNEEIERLALYGAIDKYEWRNRYWGVNEKCEEIAWFSNNYVKLVTKEGTPIGVLKVLAKRFDVTFQLLQSNGKVTSIIVIKSDSLTEVKGNNDEASAVFYLIDEPTCTYDRWLMENMKFPEHRKIDMKLLFNVNTAFLENAREIIDVKKKKFSIIV